MTDWQAWLAEHEQSVSEDEPPTDAPPPRPDRGWRRLGEIIENAFGGIVAGGGLILVLGAVVFGIRAW